ncbi:MAG: hypothetical protein JWN17_2677 [Frankiales bacterium]|nr:hypothetical protein [Frankiales bacterium]
MRRPLLALALTALAALTACGSGGSEPAAAPAPAAPLGSDSAVTASAPAAAYSWNVFHGDRAHSGYDATMPTVRGPLHVAWRSTLDGAVYGSPIVVGGRVVAATENDTVYALGTGGRVLWRTHLATPVRRADLPCGNIDPLGITGTPAYDAATGLVFVVTETGSPVRHDLVALDVKTGAKRWSRTIDRDASTAYAHQQRSALAVSGGRVYVALGGLAGDCGPYRGYVTSSATSGTGALATWVVPTGREGGIWATGNLPVDASGRVYAAVGNGESTSGGYDGSDSVTQLSPALARTSFFAPKTWADDNAKDLDLGGTGPALLGGSVVQVGKSGRGYLLSQSDLGGIGGEKASLQVCDGGAFGGTAARGQRVYVACSDGVKAVRVGASSLSVDWVAPSSVYGSPVLGGGRVWALAPADGQLHELDPASGRSVGHIAVGAVTRFATPALFTGRVLVPTKTGVVEVVNG